MMIYGFNTENENQAIASLLVYAIYRSRDTQKFKVSLDMWGLIERSCKSASKRAIGIEDFIEKFKKKMSCSSIKPKYLSSHKELEEIRILQEDGTIIGFQDTKREFGIDTVNNCDNRKVLKQLYDHTAFIILYVRDRLEREKELIKTGQLQDLEKIEEDFE